MTIQVNDKRFHARKKMPLFDKNNIPPIVDEMGSGWNQPSTRDILIDDNYTIMPVSVFKELHEYSTSMPSGVYAGKMWKRYDGIGHIRWLMQGNMPVWKLMWFGNSQDGCTGLVREDVVTNDIRTILLSDADIKQFEKTPEQIKAMLQSYLIA